MIAPVRTSLIITLTPWSTSSVHCPLAVQVQLPGICCTATSSRMRVSGIPAPTSRTLLISRPHLTRLLQSSTCQPGVPRPQHPQGCVCRAPTSCPHLTRLLQSSADIKDIAKNNASTLVGLFSPLHVSLVTASPLLYLEESWPELTNDEDRPIGLPDKLDTNWNLNSVGQILGIYTTIFILGNGLLG
jgi:hypothetical protein